MQEVNKLNIFHAEHSNFSASPPFALQSRIPPLKGFVDENNVVPDPLDTLPRNVVFLSPAEQAKEAVRSEYNNGAHLSLRQFNFHIPHIAQPTAVADVNDFLSPYIPDSASHSARLLPEKKHMPDRECPMPRGLLPRLDKTFQYRKIRCRKY